MCPFNFGNINATTTTNACIGGVVGETDGSVDGCYNFGNITSTGDNNIGGVAGRMHYSDFYVTDSYYIKNCFNEGDIIASDVVIAKST